MAGDSITRNMTGDVDAEFMIAGRNVGQSFPKRDLLKVANLSPKATPDEAKAFRPGISRRREKVVVDVHSSLVLTPLYITTVRRKEGKAGGKFAITCQSFDGVQPAARIEQPHCTNATADDVASVLKAFSERGGRNYDHTKVTEQVTELTKGTSCLQFCAIKTRTGSIPVCPHARWEEVRGRWIKPDCKESVLLIALDGDGKEVELELSGRSIQNDRKFKSPYAEYMEYLSRNKYPYYCTRVVLSTGEDGGFHYAKFSDWELVGDDEVEALKVKAHAARDGVRARQTWKKKEGSEQETPKVSFEAEKPSVVKQVSVAAKGASPSGKKSLAELAAQEDGGVTFEDNDDIPF